MGAFLTLITCGFATVLIVGGPVLLVALASRIQGK